VVSIKVTQEFTPIDYFSLNYNVNINDMLLDVVRQHFVSYCCLQSAGTSTVCSVITWE